MKLKYIFETVELGSEFIAVPVDTSAKELHGVLKLNKEGLEILNLLKEETAESSIVEVLSNKYENDRTVLAEYVHSFVEKLKISGIISE